MTQAPTVVIGFSGAVTIREADDVAKRLKQVVDSAERVEVDCSGVTEADITFIQLLISARKSALAARRTLTVNAPAGGVLAAALAMCGADRGAMEDMWTQGRVA